MREHAVDIRDAGVRDCCWKSLLLAGKWVVDGVHWGSETLQRQHNLSAPLFSVLCRRLGASELASMQILQVRA